VRTFIVGVIGFGFFQAGIQGGNTAITEPLRVCEVLENLNQYRDKPVAVLGRYSFRSSGRYLSESSCESVAQKTSAAGPGALRLEVDSKEAPKLPESFDIDAGTTDRKLRLIRKATTLGKFRFGSLEYDRWAIVYGRVEPAPDSPSSPSEKTKPELEPPSARLVYRGDGLIFFLSGE